MRPSITAIAAYSPHTCIALTTLEDIDKVPAGKYSVGLHQDTMALGNGFEDTISIALTAVNKLLNTTHIDRTRIGRVDVGSESNPDKSKSIRSIISGTFGLALTEGADHVNACYGATDALFSACDWLVAHGEDKCALVVACDIAEYDEPSAKASGGAGAVALLVEMTKDRGLCIKDGTRSTVCFNTYDFCKPYGYDYPSVRGKYSIDCYLGAFEQAYADYTARLGLETKEERQAFIDGLDGYAFHCPFGKLPLRVIGALPMYNEVLCRKTFPELSLSYGELTRLSGQDEAVKSRVETYDKCFAMNFKTGNSYTASWMMSLVSNLTRPSRQGEILVYSYGSGCIASLFVLECRSAPSLTVDINTMHAMPPSEYEKVHKHKARCLELIRQRTTCDPAEVLAEMGTEPYPLASDIFVLDRVLPDGERLYKHID